MWWGRELKGCFKTSLKSKEVTNSNVLPFFFVCNLVRFNVEGQLKYLVDTKDLFRPERSTVTVSFLDVEEYSTKLATLIQEHYYQ